VRAACARDNDDTVAQIAADALQSKWVKTIDYPDCLLYAGLGPFELVAVSRWQKENQPRDVKSRASHSIDREHGALWQCTNSGPDSLGNLRKLCTHEIPIDPFSIQNSGLTGVAF